MMDKLGNNFIYVVITGSLFLTLSPIDTIVVNYYVLKEKSLPYAFGAGLTGLISAGVTLVSIKYLKMGYMGWIVTLPVTVLISYIYYFKTIFIKEGIIPQFKIKKKFCFGPSA